MSDNNFRLGYRACRELLLQRTREPAPGLVQLLVGPRQVGKTTLLLDLAGRLGPVANYVAADGPEAVLPGFWDRVWTRADATVAAHGRAVVLLDEVHLLPDWSPRLKGEWDRIRRRRLPINVVATGSSSLRLARGSRESLAGRFERLTLAHWSAQGLVEAFRVRPDDAAGMVVRLGAYPGAFALRKEPARWAAYVRDAILEPAIGRDLLALGPVRKPGLLRQVFGVAVASPARIVSLAKIQGQLQDAGALETIAHYLSLLEDAYLVAAVPKYSTRAIRQRAAPPKLVVLSNALLAAADPQGPPDGATDPARFGGWVENACLAHAWNAGQQVRYRREEPLEVDAIVDGSWGAWAIEVKTGDIDPRRLRGLAEFTTRFPKYKPLVLCDRSLAGEAGCLAGFGVAVAAARSCPREDPGPAPGCRRLETIAHYLSLLEDAYLVAAVPKYSTRAIRQRAAPPKLVVLSNALLAAADPQGPPDGATDPARFGGWVENACLAHAWNAGQQVRYWREEPLEVDAIVDGSWGSWAIEVKTGGVDPARLRGLAEFTRRLPRYRPLVVCDASGIETVRRTGLPARRWKDFLLDGPG